MWYTIDGHEVDDNGIVVGEQASMVIERRGTRWYDVGSDAPIRAELSEYGALHIVGDDDKDGPGWDGPCYGGTFSVSIEDAKTVGIWAPDA